EKFTFIDFKHFMLRTTSNLIKNHQVLVRLNALRGQILEKKADREQTILGRQKLYLISEQLSRDVAARVEGLSPETINHLFITQGAIISGLINLAGLEKFNNEKLPIQVFDFEVNIEKEAKEILGFYLDGLVKKNEVDG
ncbi:TetR/AcrR family transcriptional regulator, partial [Leuconostoc mesenteroides]|nr:TetR/AcrR family transcriptional regulator [Leuconostoc mesenteroides]